MYMGLGATQQQAAATVGSALLSSAGGVAMINPIAGAIVAAGGALANIVALFGPNPYNTYATEVVNQVEADVMKPNVEAWESLPAAEKTQANQAAAEQNFNNGWNYVLQSCNNPQLGSAGQNCIGDRQRGGKFDWFAAYFDPIANDPNVQANPVSSFLGGGSFNIAGIPLLPIALIGGLLLAVSD